MARAQPGEHREAAGARLRAIHEVAGDADEVGIERVHALDVPLQLVGAEKATDVEVAHVHDTEAGERRRQSRDRDAQRRHRQGTPSDRVPVHEETTDHRDADIDDGRDATIPARDVGNGDQTRVHGRHRTETHQRPHELRDGEERAAEERGERERDVERYGAAATATQAPHEPAVQRVEGDRPEHVQQGRRRGGETRRHAGDDHPLAHRNRGEEQREEGPKEGEAQTLEDVRGGRRQGGRDAHRDRSTAPGPPSRPDLHARGAPR